MTKRPADQTPPRAPLPKSPKLTRQERPLSFTLDSSKQEIGSTHPPTIPLETLDRLIGRINLIRKRTNKIQDIYVVIAIAYDANEIAGAPGCLVSSEEFDTNYARSQDLSDVVNRACHEDATREDKQALLAHSACVVCPTNQSITSFQVHFGLLLYSRMSVRFLIPCILKQI